MVLVINMGKCPQEFEMKAKVNERYLDQLFDHYMAAEIAAETDSGLESFRAMAESSLSTFLNENRLVLFRLNGTDAIAIIGLRNDDEDEDVSMWKEAMYNTMQRTGVIDTGNSPDVSSFVLSCLGTEYANEVTHGGQKYFEEIVDAALRILLDHYPGIWCVNVWSDTDDIVTDPFDIQVTTLSVGYDPYFSDAA